MYSYRVYIRLVLAILIAGPQQTALRAQPRPLFTLMEPRQTGVTFVNEISETEGFNVLAYEYFFNGAGVAVGDLDGDGLQDLFFTANMRPNRLYRNLGGLRFRDVTAQAGAAIGGREGHWKTGVTMADVNRDGRLDIYVCYSGKGEPDTRRNQLFLNLGNMRFREAAREYGLDDPGYGTQAAFFDYDRDGDPDMFLLNHSTKKVDNLEFTRYRNIPDSFAGCKLFENRNGRFLDVSEKSGISRSSLTFGLGIAVADIDRDGWPDLYVTNDYNEPDHLYLNNRDGSFRDAADTALTHMSQFSMGTEVADFNNDGLPDIISLDMMPEDNLRQKLLQLQENYEVFELMQQQGLHRQYMRNMLQMNNGDGTFSEIGQFAGVAQTDWSWTPLLADFDNDGRKDLFISNGYLRDYTNKDFLRYWGDYKVKKAMDREPVQLMDLVRAMPSTSLPNYVFRNEGDLTFSNRQKEWGIDKAAISGGAAYADLDNDGDLDLVVSNNNETAFLYRNNAESLPDRHYLTLRLLDRNGAPAVGAKATLHAAGSLQYIELGQNRGYLSSVTPLVHFGLGATRRVDSLRIEWPDGRALTLQGLPTDTLLVIRASDTRIAAAPTVGVARPAKTVFRATTTPFEYRHEGFGENDFKRQLLMLFMYSNAGPVMATADVDRDGRQDIFVSGTRSSRGRVMLQDVGGAFRPVPGLEIVNEEEAAVSAACFADVNGDGWPDLYVAKGGYSVWEPHTPSLQDELYLNDGKGGFRLDSAALPDVSASAKSCVRPADFDGDGDIDLFVGGRVVPGRYPTTPESYLLVNDGKGRFRKAAVPMTYAGMVTDAQWADMDADGRPDLVVVGEFMPITVYHNRKDGFEDATEGYFPTPLSGIWNCVRVFDADGDGSPDILAGNVGRNVPFRVSDSQPAEMVYADFDANGSIDPFFCFSIQGRMYPYVSRDELNEQMYAMRRKFNSYAQYADATLEDILTKDDLAKAIRLGMNEQETVLLLRRGGTYATRAQLPVQAQFSLVRQALVSDFDGDGRTDILLFGNQSANRLKMGAISANPGCLLKGDGKGGFVYAGPASSGLRTRGDVKSVATLDVAGRRMLLIGATDQPLQAYAY